MVSGEWCSGYDRSVIVNAVAVPVSLPGSRGISLLRRVPRARSNRSPFRVDFVTSQAQLATYLRQQGHDWEPIWENILDVSECSDRLPLSSCWNN